MASELRYHPDVDQQALAGAFNETVSALLPITRLREARGETSETLASLDEAGLFGLAVGEQNGGSGLSAAEEALILVAVGRQLAAPSIVATIGACPAIAAAGLAAGKAPRVASAYRQIHGGMGFSDEADPHLFLKRAQMFIAIARGLEAAVERIAAIGPMVANDR